MSGGSCNYVYSAELGEHSGDIKTIVAYLREHGMNDAADRAQECIDTLEKAEAIQTEMRNIWQWVEWRLSSDSSHDSVEAAVAEWRAKTDPNHLAYERGFKAGVESAIDSLRMLKP